jgi:hypothetical protein
MSQAGRLAGGGGGLSPIEEIIGDVGYVTGTPVSLLANPNAGASVFFSANSGHTTMDLLVSDSAANTFVGQNAGVIETKAPAGANTGFGYGVLAALNGTVLNAEGNTCIGALCGELISTGSNNCGWGAESLLQVTTGNGNVAGGSSTLTQLASGSNNIAIGNSALTLLETGSQVIAIGYEVGSSYTSSESSNILIAAAGTAGESNVMRLGTTGSSAGEVNKTFVAGIVGNTVSNANLVTINTSTGQLGVTPQSDLFNYTNVTHLASPYTVLSTDDYLSVDCSGGVVTLKFPNAPTTYETYIVKDRTGSAATSNISLTTVGGSVTIDGQTTYTISSNYASVQLLFNGTSYEVF